MGPVSTYVVGTEVLRRGNRLGVAVDVAHGDAHRVYHHQAVDTFAYLAHRRRAPIHSADHRDHARLIAQTDGVGGIPPRQSVFPDLAATANGMARIADIDAKDHVGVGSDLMGLVGPSVLTATLAAMPSN